MTSFSGRTSPGIHLASQAHAPAARSRLEMTYNAAVWGLIDAQDDLAEEVRRVEPREGFLRIGERELPVHDRLELATPEGGHHLVELLGIRHRASPNGSL